MLYLIKKELTANARYMLVGLAIFIAYAVLFSGNGYGLFMLCLVFCFYSITTTNMVVDERYKIDLLISTLPLRRRDVVVSKHLLIVVIFIICFVLYTLLSVGGRALGYDKIPMLSFESAMLGLFAVSLFNAVMLPLCYKFGAQTTRYVALFLAMAVFLVSSINIPQVSGFSASLSDTQLGLLLLGGAIIFNIISFMLSYPVYAKKDF